MAAPTLPTESSFFDGEDDGDGMGFFGDAFSGFGDLFEDMKFEAHASAGWLHMAQFDERLKVLCSLYILMGKRSGDHTKALYTTLQN